MSIHTWLVVGVLWFSTSISFVKAAKLRNWIGPNLFFEGQLPQIRANHGFTANDDGKLYSFGGFGANGKSGWKLAQSFDFSTNRLNGRFSLLILQLSIGIFC
jgi:hypothetical protein